MVLDNLTVSDWKVVIEQYKKDKWVYLGYEIYKKKTFIRVLQYIKKLCKALSKGDIERTINFYKGYNFSIADGPVRLTTLMGVSLSINMEKFRKMTNEEINKLEFMRYNTKSGIVVIGYWISVEEINQKT